jgi:hypothetical protein
MLSIDSLIRCWSAPDFCIKSKIQVKQMVLHHRAPSCFLENLAVRDSLRMSSKSETRKGRPGSKGGGYLHLLDLSTFLLLTMRGSSSSNSSPFSSGVRLISKSEAGRKSSKPPFPSSSEESLHSSPLASCKTNVLFEGPDLCRMLTEAFACKQKRQDRLRSKLHGSGQRLRLLMVLF